MCQALSLPGTAWLHLLLSLALSLYGSGLGSSFPISLEPMGRLVSCTQDGVSGSADAGGWFDELLGLEFCPSPYLLALTPSLGLSEHDAGNFFPLLQEAL